MPLLIPYLILLQKTQQHSESSLTARNCVSFLSGWCRESMAQPAPFSGMAEDYSRILFQCSLYFEMQPQGFPSEQSKIAYIISLLYGRALQWARTLWETTLQLLAHWMISPPTLKRSLDIRLVPFLCMTNSTICFRDSTVADYALQFQILAAASYWNKAALITAY